MRVFILLIDKFIKPPFVEALSLLEARLKNMLNWPSLVEFPSWDINIQYAHCKQLLYTFLAPKVEAVDSKLTKQHIIGLAIGCILFVILVAFIFCFVYRRQKRKMDAYYMRAAGMNNYEVQWFTTSPNFPNKTILLVLLFLS